MNSAELLEALRKLESKDVSETTEFGSKYSDEDTTYDGKSYFSNLNVFSTQGFQDYPHVKGTEKFIP